MNSRRKLRKAALTLGWVGLPLLALLAVYSLYLDPSLMVTLSNAVWSCF